MRKYATFIRNFDADKFDNYTMLNPGLGWGSQDGHWQARFKINNVTDKQAGIQGLNIATACSCNEISFRAPRWHGVNISDNNYKQYRVRQQPDFVCRPYSA